MSTCALCFATTWEGRPAISRTRYCSVDRLMVTDAMRPPATVTSTQTLPRRLVPMPLKVPSLNALLVVAACGACVAVGNGLVGGAVGAGAVLLLGATLIT